MQKLLVAIFYLGNMFLPQQASAQVETDSNVVLVIHGGAGTILQKNMTPEKELAYRQKLEEALMVGYAIIESNGSSVEAVRAAIHILEDSPLFNAGKGSVYTNAETQEMDASIMHGKDKMAGAVAGVGRIKNPIDAAIAVMLNSEHVMLTGKGAEQFAKKQGIELVKKSYFKSEERLKQLREIKKQEKEQSDHASKESQQQKDPPDGRTGSENDEKFGTVGCVSVDKEGNIAAGTSTGGMTNKRYNRVGDSPIIGAGTYANNATCGVSCTGHGEFFIRNVVAYDVSALMEYKQLNIAAASEKVIIKQSEIGGTGGLIALDAKGNVAMPFNTAGMYRGYIKKDGTIVTRIYGQF